jgi:hypothetical protein
MANNIDVQGRRGRGAQRGGRRGPVEQGILQLQEPTNGDGEDQLLDDAEISYWERSGYNNAVDDNGNNDAVVPNDLNRAEWTTRLIDKFVDSMMDQVKVYG